MTASRRVTSPPRSSTNPNPASWPWAAARSLRNRARPESPCPAPAPSPTLRPMGDLGQDTAIERVDHGRFRAKLSADWEIWGPMGGYIASTALRAVGETAPFARPASFFCHYLGVAAFDTVDLTVTELRSARTARADMLQL